MNLFGHHVQGDELTNLINLMEVICEQPCVVDTFLFLGGEYWRLSRPYKGPCYLLTVLCCICLWRFQKMQDVRGDTFMIPHFLWDFPATTSKESSTQDLQKHHLNVYQSQVHGPFKMSWVKVIPLINPQQWILPLKTVISKGTCKVQNDSTCNFAVFSPALVAVSLWCIGDARMVYVPVCSLVLRFVWKHCKGEHALFHV